MKAAIARRSFLLAFTFGSLFTLAGDGPVIAGTSGAVTYKLKEVSAFEQGSEFTRGQMAPSQDKPYAEVKNYPVLKSTKPIYGSVRFGAQRGKKDSGWVYYFIIDESGGTGKGYDRLIMDRNRDLDLRNDTELKPDGAAPDGARMQWSNIREQVVFEPVELEFDCGAAGLRKVPLLPRLVVSKYSTKEGREEEYKQISLIRTRAYVGDIKVGAKEFQAVLGNDYAIDGRLDVPGTALLLRTKGQNHNEPFRWWGGDRLSAIHKVDGKFYRFAATPLGDQLTVSAYDGEVGKLELGPGKRKLDKCSIQGSFEAADYAVPVGGESKDGWFSDASSCQLPVGDYSPNYVTVNYGILRVNISFNYHSDGKPRERGDRERVYGIHIRKDQSYIWDFSNAPEVMFASPAKDKKLKRGETLEVSAVLTDPKLDFMIRGLDDTARKQTKNPDGTPLGYERNLSLDPKVLITRMNGEKVAEGVMPFG
jgi:hypothetical protein